MKIVGCDLHTRYQPGAPSLRVLGARVGFRREGRPAPTQPLLTGAEFITREL